ncbi:hypothetical protein FIBSPDRAFT_375764 [Athelia psychrophila]|uniref:DUF6533 domain-containing protein n=1 Tax=Athelia psychrophila TaxID=1759441 RepID=A0A166W079_9AGAM|nr:hypothetical protein FIBSPDRAFT_375764 [Fibularhizoctonia sp. CBS 109695]
MSLWHDIGVVEVQVDRSEGYAVTACGALLIYDILCTMDREVEYVWDSPWCFRTILYALNRYLPFIDTFIAWQMFSGVNSPKECLRGNTALSWFVVLGIIISEAVIMVRTYALWGRCRSVLYGLVALFILTMVPVIAVTYLETASWRYGPSPLSDEKGCFTSSMGRIIFVAYICLIVCETCIMVLTAIKAIKHLRRTRCSWIKRMYQDGLLFYTYTLLTSIINVVVPLAAPSVYANMFVTPQRIFHSVVCGRVLLLLLEQRKDDGDAASTMPVFTSVFGGDALDCTTCTAVSVRLPRPTVISDDIVDCAAFSEKFCDA